MEAYSVACPECDGSGKVWVANGNDGDVAREQCPICEMMKEGKKNPPTGCIKLHGIKEGK